MGLSIAWYSRQFGPRRLRLQTALGAKQCRQRLKAKIRVAHNSHGGDPTMEDRPIAGWVDSSGFSLYSHLQSSFLRPRSPLSASSPPISGRFVRTNRGTEIQVEAGRPLSNHLLAAVLAAPIAVIFLLPQWPMKPLPLPIAAVLFGLEVVGVMLLAVLASGIVSRLNRAGTVPVLQFIKETLEAEEVADGPAKR